MKKKIRPRPIRKGVRRSITTPPAKQYNWFEIKKDFISDSTATFDSLAKKHGASRVTIANHARREKWLDLRKEVEIRAEKRIMEEAERKLAEVKQRHSQVGKMLQHEGVKAIVKGKKKPRTAREALKFTSEGVRIEREAEGMDSQRQAPQVVNIIQQQKSLIDKYKVEDGEVEEPK